MTTYDTAFHPLSLDQYLSAVDAGTMVGRTSPLRTEKDYNACIGQSQSFNVDPRIPCAWSWQEGHFGSDPGLVAASVYNFGGIKWAGQPGAYDSGIAADTGGTYAGFPDSSQYWHELLRTLTNVYVGPYLRAGDVLSAARKYTNWDNPHSGDGKLAIYEQMLHDYPVSGAVNAPGVYGEDIIAHAETFIGKTTWNGEDGNQPHPSAYWCEAFAEHVPRSLGLEQIRRSTALDKMAACQQQGFLVTDGTPPEHGAWVFFDGRFFYQGHIGFWNADRKQLLGTLTQPAPNGTIDYSDWGPGTYGYGGWARIPGVVAARRVMQVQDTFILGGNPWGPIPMRGKFWARWDRLNTMDKPLDHPGAINPQGLALPDLGYPREAEKTLPDGRLVQRFERGWLKVTSDPEPFDVVRLFPEEEPK